VTAIRHPHNRVGAVKPTDVARASERRAVAVGAKIDAIDCVCTGQPYDDGFPVAFMVKGPEVVVVRVKEPILKIQAADRVFIDMPVDLPLRRVCAAAVCCVVRRLQEEVMIADERAGL